MKIGDKIIAIKNTRHITKDKEYEVIESNINGFYIKNDITNLDFYSVKDICSYFKAPSQEATTGNKVFGSTPSHYDNTNGSLYLFAEQHKLNAWEADIVKRVVRCRKKGSFIEDLEKTKFLIDLYIKEYDEKK